MHTRKAMHGQEACQACIPSACRLNVQHVRFQVVGQALLPATALFESAAAAAAVMLDIPGTAPAAAQPALLRTALPAPMRINAGRASVLETSIACAPRASPAGVTVRSLRSGSAQRAVHLTAQAAACRKLPMAAGAPAAGRQGPPSKALAGVLRAAVAHQRLHEGAAAPAALGSLATEGPAHDEGSGFRAHIAASDACLHLGAFLGMSRRVGDGGSAGARVPVAMQAAMAPAQCAAGSAAWAAVGCVEPLAGGGALSSYAVSGAQNPGSSLAICGMRAMPMQAAAPTAPQRASSQPPAGMQYALEWRAVLASSVHAPGAHVRSRRPLNALWRLQPADRAPAELTKAVSSQALQRVRVGSLASMQSYEQAGAVLAGTAASLAVVQRIVAAARQPQTSLELEKPSDASGVRPTMQLWTACSAPGGPGMPGAEPAGAAALAVSILRVAAQEQPSVHWEAVHVAAATGTPAALGARVAVEAADRADTFGAAVWQGVLLRPQMLRRRSKGFAGGLTETFCPAALGGSVLVTGGLGGLGALAGSWLALQGSDLRAPHVWLIGRSARPTQGLPAHLLASSCAVSANSCDLGARSEVSALLQTLALATPRAPALSRLLHAGGALEDAALPDQALGSLRRVAAPKLAGAACLGAATAAMPLAAAALFSSTSALLGPPGQANYAAANAALGAAAEAQQAAGALRLCFLGC